MRELITILLLLFLFPFYSCERRGSTQEGEAFLNKMQYIPDSSRVDIEYKKLLLESELKYDFTIEQLLRLKKMLLYNLNIDLTQEEKKTIYDQIEELAVKTGNDSTLIFSRAFVFNAMCWNIPDSVQLSNILKRDEAFILKHKKWDDLRGSYYLGMSLSYSRLLNYEKANYYAFKGRSYTKNLPAWYLGVSENMLNGKLYPQAIIYADSVIAIASVDAAKLSSSISAHAIKSSALAAIGRTEEALEIYKIIEDKIEEKREKAMLGRRQKELSDIVAYSVQDCYYLYNYALLLKQTGNIKESLRVLDKIAFFTKYDSYTNPNKHIATEISKNIPRLLSECYDLLGDSKRSEYYAMRADSILLVIKKMEVDRAVNANYHRLSESQLTGILAQKKLKESRADILKYLMVSVIGLLLAIIIVGWLWWQQRRKRIKILFEQMIYKHAAWANLQLSAANDIESDLNIQDDAISEQENAIPLHYPIIYRKINNIMKSKALFLNPNFELLTLSQEAGISRTLLSNVINRHAGMNFKDWLAEYRVNYLLEQIKINPNIEINDLYLHAGFNSRATFFRHFRNVTGLTPKQYIGHLKYSEDGDE